ncbi:MAG: shikimate kinase [Lactobacillales bacterium]|jgi:shikimate kinase|nr:shikimate kinase [Lactobacillales bacterium]
MAIVLVGFMGSGKTSVGQVLAEELALPWIDLDEKFTEKFNMQISYFFEKFGEGVFREKEGQLLAKEIGKEVVLSTGGGVVICESNRKILKKSLRCVYLSTPFSVIVQRIKTDSCTIRPLATRLSQKNNSVKNLENLYQERTIWYEEVADLIVETEGKTPMDIAKEILLKLKKDKEVIN